MSNEKNKLVEINNLRKFFKVGKNAILKAVDNVNLFIEEGETLGLVGESGCGKTTLGRTIVRLYEPTQGEVLFEGKNVHKLTGAELKNFNRKAQMIFQDPYASLNPRMTVGDIIGEGIDIHGLHSGKDRTERIYELLRTVGLNKEHANRFPHEFSGGQRQRIGIARALAVEPKFIVCDEP
ncbi:ATP-binding cassette domain-containing protein, partial [Thermovenabulum sp.]